MKKTLCVLICALVIADIAGAQRITLEITNPLDQDRPSAICLGQAPLLAPGVSPGAYEGTLSDGTVIPVQLDDVDGNGIADELVVVLDLPSAGTVDLWVDAQRPWTGASWTDARTSWRWDGYAALETDRMGFGLYGIFAPAGFPPALQWDLYGKRPEAWGLSLDALEGVDYHSDNEVAVDFLLVGNSMGLGGPTIGETRPVHDVNATYEYRAISRGPVRSGLEVVVSDWQTARGGSYLATIRYFVYAHHDFIDAGFTLRPAVSAPDGPFGVGLRRIPTPDVFLGSEREGILAVMGQQPGIIGKTGMAVLFDPKRFARWGVRSAEDDSYVVHLDGTERPSVEAGESESFYRTRLVAVWSEGGIADEETMVPHCRDLAMRFQHPVTVAR